MSLAPSPPALPSIDLDEMTGQDRTWLVISWPKAAVDLLPLVLSVVVDARAGTCLAIWLTREPSRTNIAPWLERLCHGHRLPLRVCVDRPDLLDTAALAKWCAQHGMQAVHCPAAEQAEVIANLGRSLAVLFEAIIDWLQDPPTHVLSLGTWLEDWRVAHNATRPGGGYAGDIGAQDQT